MSPLCYNSFMDFRLIQIDDISDSRLDIFARLNENALFRINEPDPGIFIAESPLIAGRALDAGYEPVCALVDEREIESRDTASVLKRLTGIDIYTSSADILVKITGFSLTRGLLCAMKRRPLPTVPDILSGSSRIAVLEDIVNPTNTGAIFRSAAAFSMDAVLLTRPCADPLQRRADRVSMGNVFHIPWTYLPDDWMDVLKDFGFKTAAMALRDNAISITDPSLKAESRLAVLIGSEGPGLKNTTIDAADYVVKIPISPAVDSLNAAAASAIAFFELTK